MFDIVNQNGEAVCFINGGRTPKNMADGVSQFAAVEGVEVEVFDTFAREDFDHVDGDAGGNKVARALVVIQTFVHFRQPAWDFDIGHLGHFSQLFEIGYGQDAGEQFQRQCPSSRNGRGSADSFPRQRKIG